MSKDFSTKPEQRKYKRMNLELPVRLEVDGKEVVSTTENISCGGMFMPLQQNADFAKDKSLTAFIKLPKGSKEVRLAGKICRVKKNQDGGIAGMAVEFCGLYDDNLLEIDRYLKWKRLN